MLPVLDVVGISCNEHSISTSSKSTTP